MTIFNTAYDTHACKGFNIGRIQGDIRRAYISGWLPMWSPNIIAVQDGEQSTDTIPAFTHPMVVPGEGSAPIQLAVDVRPFGKWDRANYKFLINNEAEFDLLQTRARLNVYWLEEVEAGHEPTHARNLSPLCMRVYSDWITLETARRFALEPEQQYQLSILAAVFYYCQFSNATEFTEHEKHGCSSLISRSLKVSQPDVLQLLDKIETTISGVADFCQKAAEVTGSIRLQEFTPAVLFALVGGTWFSAQGRELVHTALEHPPTWIALVYRAIQEKSYQQSGIGKLVNRGSAASLTGEFVRSLVTLLNDRVPLTRETSGL